MIFQKLGLVWRSQPGFTLIEVILALAIICLIGAGVGTATVQLFKQGLRNGDYTTASRHTLNAIHWVSRDAQMSQAVETDGASGFPLTLSWIEWDSSEHQVVYNLEDDKLKRSYSIDSGEPSQTVVAEYVNSISENTTCEFTDGILRLSVTATVGKGAHAISVTNVREILLRPSL